MEEHHLTDSNSYLWVINPEVIDIAIYLTFIRRFVMDIYSVLTVILLASISIGWLCFNDKIMNFINARIS